MKNWICFLGALCALAAIGCGDDDGRGGDPPPIMLMDSGTPPPPMDAGPVDTGTPPAVDCTVDSQLFLQGAGCFPRCSSATATAVNACTDGTCIQNALDADTTPSINITVMGTALEVDCTTCYSLPINACLAQSCPTEFNNWAMCQQSGGDCTAQDTALNTCFMTNQSAIQTCATPRIQSCFGM